MAVALCCVLYRTFFFFRDSRVLMIIVISVFSLLGAVTLSISWSLEVSSELLFIHCSAAFPFTIVFLLPVLYLLLWFRSIV